MAKLNPIGWWLAFLRTPNTQPVKVIGVSFLVALACSLVVSYVSVSLKPLQDANRLGEKSASLFEIIEAIGADLPDMRLVELNSGSYVNRDPGTYGVLDPAQDIARLKEVEHVAPVYEVWKDDALSMVVLPVRGSGYKSTLRGYLALEKDLRTVAALMFYEQDETPGMGARIAEDEWQGLWPGKVTTDPAGVIRIGVVEGKGTGPFEVDGISGATRTGTGVTNLVRFWLGPNGYGPYLARLKAERGL